MVQIIGAVGILRTAGLQVEERPIVERDHLIGSQEVETERNRPVFIEGFPQHAGIAIDAETDTRGVTRPIGIYEAVINQHLYDRETSGQFLLPITPVIALPLQVCSHVESEGNRHEPTEFGSHVEEILLLHLLDETVGVITEPGSDLHVRGCDDAGGSGDDGTAQIVDLDIVESHAKSTVHRMVAMTVGSLTDGDDHHDERQTDEHPVRGVEGVTRPADLAVGLDGVGNRATEEGSGTDRGNEEGTPSLTVGFRACIGSLIELLFDVILLVDGGDHDDHSSASRASIPRAPTDLPATYSPGS